MSPRDRHREFVADDRTERVLAGVRADPAAPLRLAVIAPAGHGKTSLLAQLRRHWPNVVDSSAPGTSDEPLIVDDAHLLDADQLAQVMTHLATGRNRVVLAARPWPTIPALEQVLAELTRDESALSPAALTREQVAQLTESSTARQPTSATVRFLHALTGGVPGFLVRLLDAAPADAIHDWAARRSLPRSVIEAFQGDVQQLDEPSAQLMIAADAGAGADLSLLGALIRTDPAALSQLIQGVRATALLGPAGHPPPIVGLAVRTLSRTDRRLDVLQRMLDFRQRCGQPVLDVARKLLDTGATGERAADAFETAAYEAIDTDAVAAAHLFQAAAKAGRSTVVLAPGWARAAALAGDLTTALRLSDTLISDPTADVAAIGAAVAATVMAHRGELARSTELFRWSGLDDTKAFVAIGLIATGHPSPARAPHDRGPGDTPPTLLAGAAVRMEQGVRESITGTPGDAMASLISAASMLEPAGTAVLIPDSPAALAGLVGLHDGDLALAESVLERALRTQVGGASYLPRHRLLLSWAAMTRGDLARSASLLTPGPGEPATQARDHLFRTSIQLGLTRRSSDITGMRRSWDGAYQAIMQSQTDLFMLLPLGELIIAAARLDEQERLTRHTAHATSLLADLDDPPLWSALLRWSQFHAAVVTGDTEQAETHAAALRRHASFSKFTETLSDAADGWLGVVSGSADPDKIIDAAQRLHAHGLRWDAARLTGQAAMRTTDRHAMVTLLETARRFRPAHHEPLPSTDHGATGVHGNTATADVSILSQREQQVAQLVLKGLTYKQIGAQLYIAAKTVEHHVARMRSRLGATDRTELLNQLRDLVGAPAADPETTGRDVAGTLE